jgi:hypothetical protein
MSDRSTLLCSVFHRSPDTEHEVYVERFGNQWR